MVKSTYIMAKSEAVHVKASAKGKGEISDQVCTAKEWKSLWNIKAPPKTENCSMAFCAQLFANWATTQEEKHPSL
jgi:hypothetical protein